jgi:outer membrane murein-binding lipoprotein Lpp
MESELSSAAEQMFMRFDAFRSKVAAEEENAKRAFERFDRFMKKSESESADQ